MNDSFIPARSAVPATARSGAVLTLDHISRHVMQGDTRLDILRDVSASINAGEMVALVGPSGSGKTTLLQITGLLAHPDSGSITLDGTECGKASDAARTALRLKTLGFVYQFHHLLPEFTAEENVMMPMLIAGASRANAKAQARELLEKLGLGERLAHRPSQMSGGEQQRVAIARALIHSPKLVLADEPTGNLDPVTAEQVFSMLMERAKAQGVAVLVATHNMDLAKRMNRTLHMERGVLKSL